MLNNLPCVARDPIVGLMAEAIADRNSDKVDLVAGIYRNASGSTPIFEAVRSVEQHLLKTDDTKIYTKQTGPEEALEAIQELILEKWYKQRSLHIAGTMTVGGTGAIRVGAELIQRNSCQPSVWLSNPSWSNHARIFSLLGFNVRYYEFLDDNGSELIPERMFDSLENSQTGDVLLLHGCCHNPTGMDLPNEVWKELAVFAQKRKLIPFIDLAYQGFGESVSKDVHNLHELIGVCDTVLIASSCSKNFGLYRERVGSLSVLCQSDKQKRSIQDNINTITRALYSFPPAHGALIVREILKSTTLRALWECELNTYVKRITSIKERLVDEVNDLSYSRIDLSYIMKQRGMFAFLRIDPTAIATLKSNESIYMTEEGRINVTGLSDPKLSLFSQKLVEILLNVEV